MGFSIFAQIYRSLIDIYQLSQNINWSTIDNSQQQFIFIIFQMLTHMINSKIITHQANDYELMVTLKIIFKLKSLIILLFEFKRNLYVNF